ncbi:toxin-antitoxin system YwqK family antitoxin [Gilvibacter sp.]|uniref:toxin-antitoxin system YwqK family antitoxin n=1 Tax=Gilvibacter sp. TaxID=2729997 RepID=UPI0035BE5595
MRLKAVYFLLFFSLSAVVSAQDTVNQFDADGQRHGIWKKYYPNSKQLRYQGEFNHGKEVGTFKFYCEDCGAQPALVKEFEAGSDRATLTYYSQSGKLISTGQMDGKQKTGTWLYYHKDGKTVMTEENYLNDLLDGPMTTFYPNGNKTETVVYKQGKKEGESRYYSPAGVEIKFFTYANDKLNGPVKYYDATGNLIVSGSYKNDAKHGLWQYFDNGKVVKEERFPKPNGQR